MALDVYLNTGANDVDLDDSSGEFVLVDPNNDFLMISNGSTEVVDGADIPSTSERVQAGVIRTGSQIIVDKYFLGDISENLTKEIFLMGNKDNRNVLVLDFDSDTASEPTLHLYDDINLNTINNTMLGAGVASSSWWRGITTTDGLPGVNWALTADKLAGDSSGNFLLLNNGNGALPAAGRLSANLCVIVPPSAPAIGFSATPKIAIKWLDN